MDKNCTAELLRLRNYILAIAIFLFVFMEHSFSYTFSISKICFFPLIGDLFRQPVYIILSLLLCLFIVPKLGWDTFEDCCKRTEAYPILHNDSSLMLC